MGNVIYCTSPAAASNAMSPNKVGIASLYIIFFATLLWLVSIDTVIFAV